MRSNTLLLFFAFAAVLALGACSAQRHDTSAPPARPSGDVSLPQPSPECYTASFDCSVQGVKLAGLLRMQRDSIIWLSLTKYVELGRAVLTPDSVFVFAKVSHQAFAGTYHELLLLTGTDLDFFSLQQLFLDASVSGKSHFSLHLAFNGTPSDVVVDVKRFAPAANLKYPYSVPTSARPF